MYQICFYVPKSHLESVKKAMFEAGAGQIGNYQYCAWETLGQGQFMPIEGSNPYLGKEHQIEKVEEYKVEMVSSKKHIQAVICALKNSHPYEEPAFHVQALKDF